MAHRLGRVVPIVLLLASLILAIPVATAAPPSGAEASATTAASWLRGQIQPDGGFSEVWIDA